MTITWFLSLVFFCLTGLALAAGYDSTLAGLICFANIVLLLSPRLNTLPSGSRKPGDDIE